MDAAFRAGTGDYIHQQGPSPQQLEHDGVGHVVARVGDPIGPCAFSSLAATREMSASIAVAPGGEIECSGSKPSACRKPPVKVEISGL